MSSKRSRLERLPLDPERGKPDVLAVARHVFEEVARDRHRNDVPNILGVVVADGLERDADDLEELVKDRASAVPRIDCRVDLKREEPTAG